MSLTEAERKYLQRAEVAAEGCLRPDGVRQRNVCESLVKKGLFVRVQGDAYTTPAIADMLGLTIIDAP